MLEIWGRPYSSNVIPVIWTAEEVGVNWKLKLAGGSFGHLDTPPFGKMNPNRMIPVISDNGFVLWESLAIVRYLSQRYAMGTLCPNDIEQRALADQWMEWSSTRAFSPVIQAFFATVRTAPQKRNPNLIADHAAEAGRMLSILDVHLADRNYVAGEAFTMGDIPLGCIAYRYFNIDIERPALPNVETWYGRLAERPAYQKHVMRFFGTNPDEWQALEIACKDEGTN